MNSENRFLVLNKYQIDYTNMLGKGAMAKVYLGYYRAGESDKTTVFAVK
jgi:predicted Ser/Thr protein kinase